MDSLPSLIPGPCSTTVNPRGYARRLSPCAAKGDRLLVRLAAPPTWHARTSAMICFNASDGMMETGGAQQIQMVVHQPGPFAAVLPARRALNQTGPLVAERSYPVAHSFLVRLHWDLKDRWDGAHQLPRRMRREWERVGVSTIREHAEATNVHRRESALLLPKGSRKLPPMIEHADAGL